MTYIQNTLTARYAGQMRVALTPLLITGVKPVMTPEEIAACLQS